LFFFLPQINGFIHGGGGVDLEGLLRCHSTGRLDNRLLIRFKECTTVQ